MPEQFAHAVGEAIAVVTEIFEQARAFAQLDDARLQGLQAPETARIGAQTIGEDLGVAAVVFGAGGRKAVTEANGLGHGWIGHLRDVMDVGGGPHVRYPEVRRAGS